MDFFSSTSHHSALFCHWSANSCFRKFLLFETVISATCRPFLSTMNNPNIDLAQFFLKKIHKSTTSTNPKPLNFGNTHPVVMPDKYFLNYLIGKLFIT